ncbi:MAG: 2-hydroxychromene-2-carboxylate isomerase [Pseudomonadota bacterium]
MHQLEFFFDCSSPWTYLAFEHVQSELEGLAVNIQWRPILVGGLFNTINPSVYQQRENPVAAKSAYADKDLQDWARYVGIKIGMPPVFPVNSVKVMRGCFVALEEGCLIPYARSVFARYWGDLADISQSAEVEALAAGAGMDVGAFMAKISDQSYKDKLKETTSELATRGGFGSPTMFLNGEDMYFGNDRIELIRAKLANMTEG